MCLTPLVLPAILSSLQLEPTTRDSSKGSRRSLQPTAQCQKLENLLQQFRSLQIGPDNSPLFQPVTSIDAYHNQSDLPEVSGLDLSPLPDDNFNLSAVNQPDWLCAPPFRSLSPKLADIPTVASKETSETETSSDTPFQENLANEMNLSDFMPGVYIYPLDTMMTDRGVTPHLPFFFFSLCSYLLDPSGLSFRTNPGSQENPSALAQPPSAAALHLGPMSTPSNIIFPPPAQPTNTRNLPVQNCPMANPAPQMPLCGTQNAPKFDGKTPALLPHFLKDVDILGTAASITDLEKIRAAIRYADLEEMEGWELLDEVTANPPDWANFTQAAKKLYPVAKAPTDTVRPIFNIWSRSFGPR